MQVSVDARKSTRRTKYLRRETADVSSTRPMDIHHQGLRWKHLHAISALEVAAQAITCQKFLKPAALELHEKDHFADIDCAEITTAQKLLLRGNKRPLPLSVFLKELGEATL